MTARTATCPSCGAPIEFLWSSAVQTTCAYCRSILVRHDVDLERVGVVADLPPNASPIQRGTDGRYRGRPFTVVGRIVYEWERGGWNEWHLRFADGASGWLSDAQLEYAISFQTEAPQALPGPTQVRPGTKLYVNDATESLVVSTVTRARYRGVEGELPFEYWDKDEVTFADCRSVDERFATIDYSEAPPLLFVGEHVRFADLALRELREFPGWPRPA